MKLQDLLWQPHSHFATRVAWIRPMLHLYYLVEQVKRLRTMEMVFRSHWAYREAFVVLEEQQEFGNKRKVISKCLCLVTFSKACANPSSIAPQERAHLHYRPSFEYYRGTGGVR